MKIFYLNNNRKFRKISDIVFYSLQFNLVSVKKLESDFKGILNRYKNSLKMDKLLQKKQIKKELISTVFILYRCQHENSFLWNLRLEISIMLENSSDCFHRYKLYLCNKIRRTINLSKIYFFMLVSQARAFLLTTSSIRTFIGSLSLTR